MSKVKYTRRLWTTEDESELRELWCNSDFSLGNLERKMGRSKDSIKLKANRLGLGPRNVGTEFITVAEISKEMQVSKDRVYRWIRAGLKTKKVLAGRATKMISTEDLLEFLDYNKNLFDASLISEYMIIKEPKWLKEKRKADSDRSTKVYKSYREWDDAEDRYLIALLKKGLSYKEIADRMERTDVAIENRVGTLNIGYVNAIFWSSKEIKYLRENSKYMTVDKIGKTLKRTNKAVESKCRELGLEYHISKDRCKRRA